MKLIGSLTLTLILAASAYAGNMPNEVKQPDPVTTQSSNTETPTVTEIFLAVVSALGLI